MSDYGSFKSYLIGFIACVVVTLLAFAVVSKNWLAGDAAFVAIVALALIQLFIQLKCFLHLSFKSESRWKLVTFIFTVIILAIIVAGTLWIMWSLNQKMMIH